MRLSASALSRAGASAHSRVAAAVLLAVACAQPVATRHYPAGDEGVVLQRIAVYPFSPGPRLTQAAAAPQAPTRNPSPPPSEATQLVTRFVTEAIGARGVQMVAAEDVRRAVGPGASPPPPRRVAQVAHAEFGAEAVLVGQVHRYRDRTGEALGTAQPASIWFEVTLYSAPGGARMWSATFNETQKPLGENVLATSRYPGGGTRWLRAEELARWGAGEVAKQFPAGR